MKSIIEKQILEWKEELAKQVKTKDQAEKVLMEANKAILMIEGGIQAKEMLLKKIEQESQLTSIVELNQQSKQKPRK
tara:strand:+ start:337 stop:567 length:231 start_codon:yes stop_codon:yes gene_type:complete